MASWKQRLIGLGLPCLLAFLLDMGLTLHGQPAEYWAGDYTQTTEGAPFYYKLFVWHPVAAACGYILWLSILGGLLILLPEVLAVILTIAVAFGHTAGAYTWLQSMLWRANGIEAGGWYQMANGMFLLCAITLGIGIRWTVRASALRCELAPKQWLPRKIRLILAVALTGAGTAIVFVPW